MKHSEIIQKNDKELGILLADTRKQLSQLSIDMRTKQVPNIKQAHALKKTIARVLTVQRERQNKEEANNG